MGQNEHQSAAQLEQDTPMQDAYDLPVESLLVNADNISTGTGHQNEKIKDEPTKEEEEERPICRICHCSSEDLENGSQADCPVSLAKESFHDKSSRPTDHSKIDMEDPYFLITPCFCTGSLQYVHHTCLQHWIRSSNRSYCELCKYSFKLKKKSKPIYKWECLNMTRNEQRKLIFQLLFNFISIIFVFWSIYVIAAAERAAHQIQARLDWRFWLKMLIVTIGFVCGILFIFFQLKLYISTVVRWKQYNQIIIIENVNSDQPMSTISTTIEMTNNESK